MPRFILEDGEDPDEDDDFDEDDEDRDEDDDEDGEDGPEDDDVETWQVSRFLIPLKGSLGLTSPPELLDWRPIP